LERSIASLSSKVKCLIGVADPAEKGDIPSGGGRRLEKEV
jgi:hypothetical protein